MAWNDDSPESRLEKAVELANQMGRDSLTADQLIQETTRVPGDLTPEQVEYVRNKVARMATVEEVQDLRDKETKLPFVEGGRPSALKVFDERIAELTATKEG